MTKYYKTKKVGYIEYIKRVNARKWYGLDRSLDDNAGWEIIPSIQHFKLELYYEISEAELMLELL